MAQESKECLRCRLTSCRRSLRRCKAVSCFKFPWLPGRRGWDADPRAAVCGPLECLSASTCASSLRREGAIRVHHAPTRSTRAIYSGSAISGSNRQNQPSKVRKNRRVSLKHGILWQCLFGGYSRYRRERHESGRPQVRAWKGASPPADVMAVDAFFANADSVRAVARLNAESFLDESSRQAAGKKPPLPA